MTDVTEVLSSQYTLVTFVGNKAGVSRTDRNATAEVLVNKGASRDAGRVIKNLWVGADAEIKAVFSAIDSARSAHYAMTAPYAHMGDNKGPRLISNLMLLPIAKGNPDGLPEHKGYIKTMAEAKTEMNRQLDALGRVYDLRRQQAMANLGGLADAADYPTFEEFRSQCDIRFGFTPVPAASDWGRTNIGQMAGSIATVLESRTKAATEAAAEAAVRDAMERVIEPLQRMATQTAPTDDGKARKIFDSLVGNLEDVVRNLKAFNIYNDPEIERIRCEIRDKLTRYSPAQIKSSATVKEELHTNAKEILAMVSDMEWMKQ